VPVWYHPQIRYASINVEVYSRQLCAFGHRSRDR